MGFLSAIRHLLADRPHAEASEASRRRFRAAWGLDGEGAATAPGSDAASVCDYDRQQWRRKLHHVFENNPGANPEWPVLRLEARALKLDDAWVAEAMKEEFTMLIRSLIADRRLSDDEQLHLDAVRLRIGWSVDEASAIVESVVADARRFFNGGVVVEGEGPAEGEAPLPA